MEEKTFVVVDHGRSKRRKDQCDSAMQLSGREVSGMQQERMSRTCNQCGNFRSGFEDENETVRSEGRGKKKNV